MTGPQRSPKPIRVLFVCTGNAGRSQMAEALLRAHGGDAFEPHSAGTHPTVVHPLTIRALDEIGVDIGPAYSKSVTVFAGQAFDHVVTVCDSAREACPVFPGARDSRHWSFDDPGAATGTEEERLRVFRRVRDEIAAQLGSFIPVALAERSAVA
jgi:arsenate reductase